MNEQQIKQYVQDYDWMAARVREIGIVVAEIRKSMTNHTADDCYVGWSFESNDSICANFEERRCGCCGPEYIAIVFPLSYLWTDNYPELEATDVEARQKAAELLQQARLATRAAEIEAYDQREFERLSAKYEK